MANEEKEEVKHKMSAKKPHFILVVEDDPEELAFAIEVVHQAGYIPFSVTDYAEACEFLPDRHNPHLQRPNDVPVGLFRGLRDRYSYEELDQLEIGLGYGPNPPARLSAVLTDLHIPYSDCPYVPVYSEDGTEIKDSREIEGTRPRPWGLPLLSLAVVSGIPSVLVTDLEAHQHDDGDWIFPVVGDLSRGKNLAYVCIRRDENGRKRWDQALDWLSKYVFKNES